MLDQIHFSVCMYITMWGTKKEEHAWMIEAKLDNFRSFDWNIIDLLTIKEIICDFQVQNVAGILWGKHISLEFLEISRIFKLPAEGIAILA